MVGLEKIFQQEQAEHQANQTQPEVLMDLEILEDLHLLGAIKIEDLPEAAELGLLEQIKAELIRVLQVVLEKAIQFQDLPQITRVGEAADHIREVEVRLTTRAAQRVTIAQEQEEDHQQPTQITVVMVQPIEAVAEVEVVRMAEAQLD